MNFHINSKEFFTNKNKINETLLEYEEYYLIKQKSVYKIIIGKLEKEIIIQCKHYKIKINEKNLLFLEKLKLNTIDKAYKLFINIFEENNVCIKEIIINKRISLSLKIVVSDKEEYIEIILDNDKQNKELNLNDLIYNNIELKYIVNKLKNKYVILKDEVDKLKILYSDLISKIKENNILFKNALSNNNINSSSPQNIEFLKELTKDSYSGYEIRNSFTIFKSINDILCMVYANKNKSILLYNMVDYKKINEIKRAHNNFISSFRHYLDSIYKRDLLLSISALDNNIKLWNANNLECLVNIKNIYNEGFLYSASLLINNKENYIITSNEYIFNNESIFVFDLKGQKIKEINDSKESTLFLDIFYDNKLSKNYIISGNRGYIKSFDFDENKIYHKYCENNKDKNFKTIIINKDEEIIKLVESSYDGNIKIWDFHSGLLLNKIKVCNNSIIGMCSWNNKYLFIGCEDKTIRLMELKKEKVIKTIIGHNNKVISLQKINHPNYGECLISQGWNNDQIKLWIIKI